MSRSRPTMKEVAEHANVSLSTVSYVLNNSGPVAADRRARVLAAVRELRYTPNEAARRLKRRSALAIGLFVPDLVNQFFALLAQGVERAASERDVLVVLSASEGNDEAESRNARLLRSQRVDGVIYLSGTCGVDQQSARAHFARAGGAGRRAPPRTRSAGGIVGWPAGRARDRTVCP